MKSPTRHPCAPKTWRAWTAMEVLRLEDIRLAGKTVPQCAAELGRTESSVKNRLIARGIVSPTWARRHEVWAAVLCRPHDIKTATAALGVTRQAVNSRKLSLRRAGFPVYRIDRGRPKTAPVPLPAEPRRLDVAQQELAAAHVWLAEKLANRFARRCPWMFEAAHSAALVGLCEAALSFDPGRGVGFEAHASRRIEGAILDAARMELPKGFRRNKGAARPIGSLSTETAAGDPRAGVIAANELPVGWEIESEDAVTALTRKLPTKHGLAVRSFYTHADTATMKRTGRLIGLSESRVSQLLAQVPEILGVNP